MSEPDEMDQPLTKREFQASVAEMRAEFLSKREFQAGVAEMRAEFLSKREFQAGMAEMRADLHAGFLSKHEFHDAMAMFFAHLDKRFEETKRDLKQVVSDEIRAHSGANADQLRREVGLVDDHYKDLPVRVTKLEAAVFPPPAKRQRRR